MDFPAELSARQFLSAMYPSEKAAMWIFAVLLLGVSGLGFWLWHTQKEWDVRVRDWDQVDAVITRNDLVRGRGRSSHTHTELRYRYVYRGRNYEGRRIAYGLKRYPPVKVGTVRRIIVDPAAPERSAALVSFSKNRSWIRYREVLMAAALAAILGIIGLNLLFRRPPEIPEKLSRYLMTVPAGSCAEAEDPPHLRDFGTWVSHPPRIDGNGVCVLGDGAWPLRVIIVLQLAAAYALLWYGKYAPGLMLLAVSLLLGRGAFPFRLEIDFPARTIRRSRRPWHDGSAPGEALPFSAIRRLEIIPARMGKRGMAALLAAVTDTGEARILGMTTARRLPALLAFLPDLATALGHLPVVFRAEAIRRDGDPASPLGKRKRKF